MKNKTKILVCISTSITYFRFLFPTSLLFVSYMSLLSVSDVDYQQFFSFCVIIDVDSSLLLKSINFQPYGKDNST